MYFQGILVAIYLICLKLCYGDDWHFSIASMFELFDLETEHINVVETYISNEYKRLNDIKRWIIEDENVLTKRLFSNFEMSRFIEQREIQNAKELEESYTESSINAFKTILRIKNDLETLKNQTARTSAIGKLHFIAYD